MYIKWQVLVQNTMYANYRSIRAGRSNWEPNAGLGEQLQRKFINLLPEEQQKKILSVYRLDWLCWDLTTRQPLWVLSRLPEKGRREIEEKVEVMEEMGQWRNENEWQWRNRRNKNSPLYPYLLQGQQALPNCKPISVGHLGDARYTTPLPHPTTPICL